MLRRLCLVHRVNLLTVDTAAVVAVVSIFVRIVIQRLSKAGKTLLHYIESLISISTENRLLFSIHNFRSIISIHYAINDETCTHAHTHTLLLYMEITFKNQQQRTQTTPLNLI